METRFLLWKPGFCNAEIPGYKARNRVSGLYRSWRLCRGQHRAAPADLSRRRVDFRARRLVESRTW